MPEEILELVESAEAAPVHGGSVVGVLDDYLTEADLARELDKSKRTLERWRRLRIGPTPTIVGNRILYAITDVQIWLRAQRQEAPHEMAS